MVLSVCTEVYSMCLQSKMGYQTGSGLGRNSQGILDPVELQNNLGRRGFGHTVEGLEPTRLQWDSSLEVTKISVKIGSFVYNCVLTDNNN